MLQRTSFRGMEQDFGCGSFGTKFFVACGYGVCFLNQSQKRILQEEVGVLPLYFPFLFNPLLALAQKLPCVTPALWRVHILPVGCGIHTVQHTLYHPIQSQHMGG